MRQRSIRVAMPAIMLVTGAAVLFGSQEGVPVAGASWHATGAHTTATKSAGKKVAGKKSSGKKSSGKHGAHGTSGPSLKVAKVAAVGTVLVDSGGQTLYAFSKDHQGKSQCDGSCAKAWPPLVVAREPVAGKGVDKSLLGTIRRAGHKLQVTYGHWPLYTFAGDTGPGEAHGQGLTAFGGKWSTIGTDGSAFTSSTGSGHSTTTTTSGGGYGGGSGGYGY